MGYDGWLPLWRCLGNQGNLLPADVRGGGWLSMAVDARAAAPDTERQVPSFLPPFS